MFTPHYLWAVVEDEFQTLDLYKLSSQQLSLTAMNMFVSEACVSLLEKLVDPAVLALRQATLEHQRFRDHQQAWVSGFTGQRRVVSGDKLRTIVNNILPLLTWYDNLFVVILMLKLMHRSLNSEDAESSGRAAYSLAVISQIDIYHWSETSKILEECGLASLIQPLVYPAREPSGVQHIFRTCCVNEDTHVEVFTLRQSTHVSVSLFHHHAHALIRSLALRSLYDSRARLPDNESFARTATSLSSSTRGSSLHF